jgi:hypothetical protein
MVLYRYMALPQRVATGWPRSSPVLTEIGGRCNWLQSQLLLLQLWTCELLPMHSPLTALTLTAYLLTQTAMRLLMLTDRLPMLTNCLTDTLTDAVPRLLILSGLSQHPYCMLSDPYPLAY